ncbi:hypothetical protein HYX14_00550 [Candidatus Woesearchaeota archaeon]|nr:hypothetical protein [Candidatus Woesearchaeota archaeon]
MPCPKCHSVKVQVTEHNGLSFVKCRQCGYDELEESYVPAQKTSQREKARYTPYKAGRKVK